MLTRRGSLITRIAAGWRSGQHCQLRDLDGDLIIPRMLAQIPNWVASYDSSRHAFTFVNGATLPALQRSATNPEDIITSPKQDDHPADALRYLLQLLVGGGHDRTARDADRDPTAGADTRDLAYDTNLITAAARPTSPMEVTRHRFRHGPTRRTAATASPNGDRG